VISEQETSRVIAYEGNGGGVGDPTRRACKFMIVQHAGVSSLVYGPVETFRYHALLLDRYCRDQNVASGWVKRPELLDILDGSVVLRGGGWMELDYGLSRLRFHGISTAYGGFDRILLTRILDAAGAFPGYRVTVD